MNGEWILQIVLVLTPALVSAAVGYFLGIRSQKKQVLREYITETVADEYPALFSEMKRNSELLDNFLEKPNESFSFPNLNEIYNSGLEEFMKSHHKDLFLIVDFLQRNMVPRFYELDTLVRELMEKLFEVSSAHLRKFLPSEAVDMR